MVFSPRWYVRARLPRTRQRATRSASIASREPRCSRDGRGRGIRGAESKVNDRDMERLSSVTVSLFALLLTESVGGTVRAVERENPATGISAAVVATPGSVRLRSKSEVFTTIAQRIGIHRRDVAGVFHVMGAIIKADLSKAGPGVFKLPGLVPLASWHHRSPRHFRALPRPSTVTHPSIPYALP